MIPGRSPSHPSFRRSFLFALQGFRTALRQERNIKVMLAGGAFAVAMGLILRIDAVSWAIVLVCCGMVIAAELLNTAIETVVDLVSPEFHPLAGQAKDIAAAASWVLSLTAAVVGVIVYANALIRLLAG
jgi:diacylglycerol kinase